MTDAERVADLERRLANQRASLDALWGEVAEARGALRESEAQREVLAGLLDRERDRLDVVRTVAATALARRAASSPAGTPADGASGAPSATSAT